MCVCVQPPGADRVLRYSIENASKRLDYPAAIYRGAVLDFCRCCHPTGRWLAALWVEKHGLIEELLTGAVFKRVRSKAYSLYSYKRGMCVGFWRDRAANMCLASVN